MEISMKHFLISCFSPWTIGVSASSSAALGFSFSLAPSLISLFPLDFFSFPSLLLFMYTHFTAWHSETAPPSAHILQPFICLNPFSLTTIKRLDFKGKSRESQAVPSQWHRIKLLGALESQMGWIPQDLSSAPCLSFSCLSKLGTLFGLNGRSEAPRVVTMWLLVINGDTMTPWAIILLVLRSQQYGTKCHLKKILVEQYCRRAYQNFKLSCSLFGSFHTFVGV